MFNMNPSPPKWDAETLADLLSNAMEYDVNVGSNFVIVQHKGDLLALVELIEDNRECIITFNYDLMPSVAAEIAVAAERILPVHIEPDEAFTAEKVTINNEGIN